MEKALGRDAAMDLAAAPEAKPLVLSPDLGGELGETRPATEISARAVGPAPPSSPSCGPPEASADAPCDGPLPAASAESNHFTTLEEEQRRSMADRSRDSWVSLLQGLALAAGLAAVAAGVWYFSQPKSADALYADIAQAAEKGDQDALLEVEGEIEQLLGRFPDDARRQEVRGYLEQIELVRAERRLAGLARRMSPGTPLGPIEQQFVDAVRLSETDPQEAVLRFAALVDLYDEEGLGEPSPEASRGREAEVEGQRRQLRRQCVELARRQLERLRSRLNRTASAHRQVLQQQLRRAEQLLQTDPKRAQRIWRALVVLYGDKPWAADLVAQAKQRIATAGPAREARADARP